jgi:hypothetical protein
MHFPEGLEDSPFNVATKDTEIFFRQIKGVKIKVFY